MKFIFSIILSFFLISCQTENKNFITPYDFGKEGNSSGSSNSSKNYQESSQPSNSTSNNSSSNQESSQPSNSTSNNSSSNSGYSY